MPEEFRIWKEKLDAIEKKKLVSQDQHSEFLERESQLKPKKKEQSSSKVTPDASSSSVTSTIKERPKIQYASKEEATNAFKDLLLDKNISVSAKMKEVQDLCQSDIRWDALPSMGEKKQALAEYQVEFLNSFLF